MTFETQYQLEQFREVQDQYFEDDGSAFGNTHFLGIAEQMLKLINQMEQEILTLEAR